MSFPRYPKYKDSGVEWLGEVPEHWGSVRFRRILRERHERSTDGSELLLSVSAYTGVTPRSEIIDDGEHLSRAESLEGYKICHRDDLVMNIMLAWNRGLGFTDYDGIVSPSYSVFRLIDGSLPRFLHYLVRSNEYTLYFKAFSAGVIDSRLRLYPETFGQLSCLLPPAAEQTAIASFLDRETAKIDALIAEQQRLIELLQEKRQAVISHAVTKGLNPDAPMKDSGIDWLGEMPEHWSIVALRRVVSSSRKITYGIVQPGSPDDTGRYMVRGQDYSEGWAGPDSIFRVSDAVESAYERSRLQMGDLVMTIVGAGIGNTEVVPEWLDGANITQTTARIAIDSRLADSRFVKAVLDSAVGKRSVGFFAKGAAQPGLNLEHVKLFVIPLPPVREQFLIAEHLERACDDVDILAREASSTITLLQERRSALISAAVTGQIDVRGFSSGGSEAA